LTIQINNEAFTRRIRLNCRSNIPGPAATSVNAFRKTGFYGIYNGLITKHCRFPIRLRKYRSVKRVIPDTPQFTPNHQLPEVSGRLGAENFQTLVICSLITNVVA
jgi:hypothetical protein